MKHSKRYSIFKKAAVCSLIMIMALATSSFTQKQQNFLSQNEMVAAKKAGAAYAPLLIHSDRISDGGSYCVTQEYTFSCTGNVGAVTWNVYNGYIARYNSPTEIVVVFGPDAQASVDVSGYVQNEEDPSGVSFESCEWAFVISPGCTE